MNKLQKSSKKKQEPKLPLEKITTFQEEEEILESNTSVGTNDIDFNALQAAIDEAGDLPEEQKDALKSEIFKQKQERFAKKKEILKAEWQEQKDIYNGMKLRNEKKEKIKLQQQSVKQAYDRWYAFTLDRTLEVPRELFELLETNLLSRVQQVWLLNFCYNGGNPIRACSKANVSVRMYREWLKGEGDRNAQFKQCKEDVDVAYTDVAEMNLKEMAASKNVAALTFYLRNNHDKYKDSKKYLNDKKKKQNSKITDYSQFKTEEKAEEFAAKVGIEPKNHE